MRYLASLLAAGVLLVVAVPAEATVQRTISTSCVSGHIRANKLADGSLWTTPTDCVFYTWEGGKYVPHGRPETDHQGALQAAGHWWPTCFRVLYDQASGGGGTYLWYFTISC